MGTITFPGLSTGIDTSTIISQLITIESRRLATYQVQKNSYDEQNTALTEVRDKVSALKTAVSTLSDADNLSIFTTSSGDTDKLTVTASTQANAGSHSIDINQLATTETWIQDTSTFSYTTDYVGEGTFIYSYNHQERAITTVADETTLQDLVNLINDDSNNPGVTASLLYYGDKYHLMLSGQEAGEDYQISVDSKYTEMWKSNTAFTNDGLNAGLTTKITELDQFTANAGFVSGEKIIISGKNHFGTNLPDKELSITANTTVGHLIDAINEQFDGVATARFVNGEIWVTDHISDTSVLEISLAYDDGTGNTQLSLPTMAVSTEGGGTPDILSLGFFSQTQAAQSSNIKIDGYPSTATDEVQTLTPNTVPTGGHYRLSYGGQTTGDIAYDASLAEIKAALEALSTVNADDITVGGDTDDGLAVGPLTFTFNSPLGDVEMLSIDAGDLTGTTSTSIAETTKGSNGYIERNSNNISDALMGVTLNLQDVTEIGSPVKITINRNTSSVLQKVQKMITAYNELVTALQDKTEYNATTKKMGILSNDMGVSLIESQSRSSFVGIAAGFVDSIDSFIQASDIGLTIDGAGMIQLDTTEFNDAMENDFSGVLDLLGATKTSSNESGVIQFYDASDKYTTAGTYNIEVDINSSHNMTDVRIKLSSESIFRDNSTWSNNLVTGYSSFDSNGEPVYPENGLQFTVDLTQPEGTYTTTIYVKQGIVGALEDLLDTVIETDGRLDISKEILDEKSEAMEKKIEAEQARLEKVKQRLVDKYARLEKTMTMLQQQMSAVNMVSSTTLS